MVKRLTLSLVISLATLASYAQQDTVVTKLREIAVVGEKQSAATDLSAVTVLAGKSIERLNVITMKDMSEIAPNFYIPSYGSRMTSSIYVRGLGARIDQPVVGLQVDGVTFLNKDNYDFDLFDIDRIEVFRGAQSILNGRNTMCGQVNITTLSPWRYQGWRFMLEYGRANTVKAGVGYYGKITSTLATSATAYFTHTDGYFRNEYNNGRLDKENMGTLRWKLSWHPSERLSLTNIASASITRQGGYPYEKLSTGQIAYNDTCFYRRNSFADGLTVGWSSKRVVITSVTSVQYIDDNMTLDQDFSPEPYFTMSQIRKEWAVTEDLYAKGHRGNFHWLGGVFGFYKRSNMSAPVTFKDKGISDLIEKYPNQINPSYPISWDERQFVLGSDFIPSNKGVALYQQSSYKYNNWDFEFGLRWDLEWDDLKYHSHCNTSYTVWHVLPDGTKEVYNHQPVNIDDKDKLSKSFNELLPKFTVGYTFPSDVRLYGNVAKGYKAGGFNTQMFSDVLQQRIMSMLGLSMPYEVDEIIGYKPEKSWNFELGVKAPLLSGKLRIEAELFYIRCTDQQLTAFPDGLTTGRIMTNAGRTRSLGGELTIMWRATDDLTLRGSYGYTNATFREYNNGKADFRGKRLPYAPSNTLFLAADYTLPCTFLGARPSFNINARGIGDIYWDEANEVRQPFYMLLGASAGLESDHWSLKLSAENITSTKFDTFYFVSMGNAFVQKGRPWNIFMTWRVNI